MGDTKSQSFEDWIILLTLAIRQDKEFCIHVEDIVVSRTILHLACWYFLILLIKNVVEKIQIPGWLFFLLLFVWVFGWFCFVVVFGFFFLFFLLPSHPSPHSIYFSTVALPRAVICTIWQSWRQSSWGRLHGRHRNLWGFLFSLNSYATEKHRKPKRDFGFMPIVWLEFLQHQNNKPSIKTKQYRQCSASASRAVYREQPSFSWK